MTNDLLHSNIHLIRLAVDKVIQHETFGRMTLDDETFKELSDFKRKLEKQETTGDST